MQADCGLSGWRDLPRLCWQCGHATVFDPIECENDRRHAMSIIWIILIGFVVGLLAKMLTPGRDPAGFFITAAIGIAGSLLATYGGQAMGLYRAGEPAGFVGSLIGAIILLVIYHMVRRNPTT
jgi:uncharacterized membrane protein YeaQ/YmgE (transglycosylase-associated protein family)